MCFFLLFLLHLLPIHFAIFVFLIHLRAHFGICLFIYSGIFVLFCCCFLFVQFSFISEMLATTKTDMMIAYSMHWGCFAKTEILNKISVVFTFRFYKTHSIQSHTHTQSNKILQLKKILLQFVYFYAK